MLNRHHNLVVPESDCLRVGECLVDVPRREVSAPHRSTRVRISLKALQVLLVLVSHQGKVVGREALLEWVWPDTLPTDDVLTQAITQLRKAFGDDRDAPRYIETIAKGGYRLLATPQWVHDDAKAGLPASAPAPTSGGAEVPTRHTAHRRVRTAWIIGPAAFVGVVGVLAIMNYTTDGQNKKQVPGTPVDQLTIGSLTSRTGRETRPALSPDGAMVAYGEVAEGASSGVIMVQTTSLVPARQLTHPGNEESDVLPAWSRDGRSIAFLRVSEQRCRVMVMTATGHDERAVAPCYGSSVQKFEWTPDGSGLLMGGTSKPGDDRSPLRLLDLASGEWRTLAYPVAAGDIDLDPHYSPDGKWIAFRRNFSLSDIWIMPAGGGRPERLTHLKGDIRGWDWMPDGRALVYAFIDGTGAALYRYEMGSGRTIRLTVPEHSLTMPDVAANRPVVVFEIDRARTGILRYPTESSGTGGTDQSDELFASSGSDLLPGVSPDGRQVAFASDRAIRLQWWIGRIGVAASVEPIVGIEPMPRHAPVWSADGRSILVIGQVNGEQSLFEVDVENRRPRRLPVLDGVPVFAGYLTVPDRLLVGVDAGGGKLQLRLYDTSNAPWRVLAAIDGVSFARHDPRTERIYFTRISRPGLWSVDMKLRDEKPVDPAYPSLRGYKRWDVTPTGVYYMLQSEDCQTGWVRLPVADKETGRCLDRKRMAIGAPDMDGAGKWIFATFTTTDNVDVGWMEIPGVGVRK